MSQEQQKPTYEQLEQIIEGKNSLLAALESQRNSSQNEVAVLRAQMDAFQRQVQAQKQHHDGEVAALREQLAVIASKAFSPTPVAAAVAEAHPAE